MKNQIGVIGLGTMGKALATNLLNNGFKVAGYNRTSTITKQMKEEQQNQEFQACETLEEFVESLESPRKIILMVPAGDAVEAMIQLLIPLINKDDILMDCGNSYYKDTIRRHNELEELGIYYYGVGVSGGEKGALLGPSIMPGGDKKVYPQIAPYLEKIAAKKNEEPCCAYMGSNGSGHYVKMVHNGIEYADMQIIAEIYLFFKNALMLSNQEISKIFTEWNKTNVSSYLIEITSKILLEKDPQSSHDLVDMIADRASQKGTGKWTIIEAAEFSQNVSMIQAAVESRITSSLDEERQKFSKNINSMSIHKIEIALPSIEDVKEAYFLGKLIAYAQGFKLIAKASDYYQWNLNLSVIASIFRAGCIIQAKLLDTLMEVYAKDLELKNFLLSSEILEDISKNVYQLRHLNIVAHCYEIPIPALSSALTYIDQLKSSSLGANLIQAQRDYFGAHTFERIDKEGRVHHEWKNQ